MHRSVRRGSLLRTRTARARSHFLAAHSHLLSASAGHQCGVAEGTRAVDTVDAVVLRCSRQSARVRVGATDERITVLANDLWHVMPGHMVTLALEQRWQHRGQLYAAGELRNPRIDVPALGLPPLKMEERGPLETAGAPEESKSSEGEPGAPADYTPLRAPLVGVARAAYEMEQVLPEVMRGSGFDPILAAVQRKNRGDACSAAELLKEVLVEDLRCLDAHAHLGNIVFPSYPEHALIHYEIGVAIGEHALGPEFAGALPWSYMDNRPFLRCLLGRALCLWRLGRMGEAQDTFERTLWLDPLDGQGARRSWLEVRRSARGD